MKSDRFLGPADVLLGTVAAQSVEIFTEGFLDRHVAVERIVGRGLIGKDIRHDAVTQQLRHDFGGVADQADRQRESLALCSQNEMESLFQVPGHAIEIASLKAALDACRVDVDAEESSAVHGGGQRLGATHAS